MRATRGCVAPGFGRRYVILGGVAATAACSGASADLESQPRKAPFEPIQLSYTPFEKIRYRLTRWYSGTQSQTMLNFELSCHRAGPGLEIVYWGRNAFGTNYVVAGTMEAHLLIQSDGHILDIPFYHSTREARPSRSALIATLKSALSDVLPIYFQGPISDGQEAAQSQTITDEKAGPYHFVFTQTGFVNYHETKTIKMELSRIISENYPVTHPVGIPQINGFLLANPICGAVMRVDLRTSSDNRVSIEAI
jgi:hypothetical protein